MRSDQHAPRKRFGQNFLRDPQVLRQILDAIDPTPEDHLVEIGPGQGALTALLLEATEHLDVIELDRDLVAHLKQRFGSAEKLRVHSGDVLNFPLDQLAADKPLRVVGNLPYNISTPLLFRLFSFTGLIRDMIFMLQREVVQRLCAGPGEADYGRLSVMARYHCAAIPLFEVPPESFYPAPRVMSQVVRLIPHAAPPVAVNAYERFARVVAAAFAQRRKILRNALKDLISVDHMRAVGVDPGQRAEELSLAQFAALSLGEEQRPVS